MDMKDQVESGFFRFSNENSEKSSKRIFVDHHVGETCQKVNRQKYMSHRHKLHIFPFFHRVCFNLNLVENTERFGDIIPKGAVDARAKEFDGGKDALVAMFRKKNVLFFFERNMNNNCIVYEANVVTGSDGKKSLDPKEPVRRVSLVSLSPFFYSLKTHINRLKYIGSCTIKKTNTKRD